jgi:two-component system, OmpR family, response regulator MprA
VPRVLVVDDEQDLTWAVQRSLSNEGYDVATAADGVEALAAINRCRPDLIILDIILPRLDGLQVCRRVRQNPDLADTPVILLTARNAIEDRVLGLDHGADDYLVKPFDLRELAARVRAMLRRGTTPSLTMPGTERPEAADPALMVGALTLDLRTRQVSRGNKAAQLTPAECELLRFLLQHRRQIFSSEQLLRQVWGYLAEAADTGLVRWHIKNLRTKIETDPLHPEVLRTVPHQGYLLDDRVN